MTYKKAITTLIGLEHKAETVVKSDALKIAIDALYKQLPKKAKRIGFNRISCPMCKKVIQYTLIDIPKYCCKCGQSITVSSEVVG